MRITSLALAACLLASGSAALADPLSTTFTYQGLLADNGAPANGSYDLQFALYDTISGGSAVQTVTLSGIAVNGGLVNAPVDFGESPFNGQGLWVEVSLRHAGGGSFTTLAPRQPINATPYALYALNAPGGGGLTLPFAGTTSSANAAFDVSNTGSGFGIHVQSAGAGFNGAALQTANTADGGLALYAFGVSPSGTTALITNDAPNNAGDIIEGWNLGVPKFRVTTAGGVAASETVDGTSSTGDGVHGHTTFSGGASGSASGVAGLGDGSNFGVYGSSGDFVGVFGTSLNGYGVQADNTGSCNSGGQFCTATLLVTNNAVGDLINASAAGTFVFRVNGNGAVFANGGYNTGGADVAEYVPGTGTLEPGDVVEIDADADGAFRLASTPNSSAVAGVISTKPGLTMNTSEAEAEAARGAPRLALTGRVPVKVSAENGAVRAGDLLVSSSTPGRAMRAPAHPDAGTVIGKAMQALDKGEGEIEMLVMLR